MKRPRAWIGHNIPTVDVVIVNWNAGATLLRCVEALLQGVASNPANKLRITVVDNASSDGSADCLDGRFGVTVLRNRENIGYACACNLGARASLADFLLFMNPDVVVDLDTVAKCVSFLGDRRQDSVAIAGPQMADASEQVLRTCSRLPTTGGLVIRTLCLDRLAPRAFQGLGMSEWDHMETRDVGQVIGAFLLVRRSVFEALGGFDCRFFLYYEEVDLCARAWARGGRVVFFADARAEHIGLVSTSQVPTRRLAYSIVSRTQYARKHFGTLFAIALFVLTLLGETPIRCAAALVRGRPTQAIGVWLAMGLAARKLLR